MGFRPFVYREAQSLGLKGWVSNTPDGVHIEFNADFKLSREFYQHCIASAPAQSKITGHRIYEVVPREFEAFEIKDSQGLGPVDLTIPPDFGICPDCRAELLDTHDRRHGYPFTTCTHCGPRYSILHQLPYDRHMTAMEGFTMCSHCNKEYEDPHDRRYYSQTNSCPDCGVSLVLYGPGGKENTDPTEVLLRVHQALQQGKIVAVKGIGGYLLLCDATKPGPVSLLRQRKNRPAKPFAVLYPGADLLEKDVFLTQSQKEYLEGPIAPVYVLPLRPVPGTGICHELISPGLHSLGVMLPYAPLLVLIAQKFEKPLVATSANLSGSPIIHDDGKARRELFQFADMVLSHDREIAIPADDSVIKSTSLPGPSIILRRSRGLAPGGHQRLNFPGETLLALGAEMKGGFSVATAHNLYVSQYLGNLGGYEAQETFRKVLTDFLALVKVKPRSLICDLHPNYFTTFLAQEMRGDLGLPLHKVQHHEAHFAAVLGENDLLDRPGPVMGVIWDGVGHGHDDQVWGGEFFTYQGGDFRRFQHFDYFPWLAGDKMSKEPRLSAFSLTRGDSLLKAAFRQEEWKVYTKLLTRPGLLTSSVGRLFDAVSSLLGALQKSTYEGQGGLLLERMASRFYTAYHWEKVPPFAFEIKDGIVSLAPMIDEMVGELLAGAAKDQLAARFHQTLVSIIGKTAQMTGHTHIAFSGGVFQNSVLVDLIRQQLSRDYHLYFHKQLSPNDENISFGQLAHYYLEQKTSSLQAKEEITTLTE